MSQAAESPPSATSTAASPSVSATELRATLIYQSRAPIAQILLDMDQLGEIDRENEQLEARAKAHTITFVVVTILTVVVSIPLMPLLGRLFPLLVPGFLLSLGAAVFFGIRWRRFGRLNFENRRYLLVAGLLKYLSADIGPDQPVQVRVDLNRYRRKEYLKKYTGGLMNPVSTYAYRQPWLEVGGKLLDGNRFSLTIEMLVKRKERQKRKYKKVAESFRERIALAITTKPGRYPQLAQIQQLVKATNLRGPFTPLNWEAQGAELTVSGLTRVSARRFGRNATVIDTPPSTDLVNVDDGLRLLVTAYGGLDLCRATRGGKSA